MKHVGFSANAQGTTLQLDTLEESKAETQFKPKFSSYVSPSDRTHQQQISTGAKVAFTADNLIERPGEVFSSLLSSFDKIRDNKEV